MTLPLATVLCETRYAAMVHTAGYRAGLIGKVGVNYSGRGCEDVQSSFADWPPIGRSSFERPTREATVLSFDQL